MKLILYYSKATGTDSDNNVPPSLAKIYVHSRKSNASHGITGILSYKLGYYLQAIEGEEENVDTLFKKINQDARHQAANVVFQAVTTRRYFPEWQMKLSSSLEGSKEFAQLIADFPKLIDDIDFQARSIINLFYPALPVATSASVPAEQYNSKGLNIEDFNGYHLQLSKWPSFNDINPEPLIIDLCARLVSGPTNAQLIFTDSQSEVERQQILTLLTYCEEMSILIKTKDHSSASLDSSKEKGSPNLYMKIKNYLLRKSAT